MAALEAQLKSQGLVELFGQVEQLKADVARLRGQIEVLNYEQEQAQKRQRDLYVDLDSRLRKLEGGPGAPCAPARPGAPARRRRGGRAAAPSPRGRRAAGAGGGAAAPRRASAAPCAADAGGDEQRAYDAALDQFKAGNYAAAIASFTAFVEDLSEEPARAVGAVLDRQRAVRAEGLSRGDRLAAAADRRVSRTARRCPTRCSTSRPASSSWATARRRGARSRN